MRIEVAEIEIADCKRGDILVATRRGPGEGVHPIVFFEQLDGHDFVGCMLTHEPLDENEPMKADHFLDTSDKFKYENTQIVKGKFHKPERWGAYYKVGRLSASGIKFVEELIDPLPLETFAHYYWRHKV